MIKRDWRFTEDGDIELGSPRGNMAGELLYVNRFGEESIDPAEGQLIRDVALHVQENVTKQTIRNRLKTDAPDWFHHPKMGGNLSDLIGEPNTRATGEKGVQLIKEAISYASYINVDKINVRPVPVSSATILFYIEIKDSTELNLEYPVLFDLDHGILSEYRVEEGE